MEEKRYLSKEKYEELKAELINLKSVKRREVADSLEYAKSLGDLKENAEYHQARDAQSTIEERISQLEEILKNAEIIKERHSDIINVGSFMVVEKKGSKDSKRYQIVGTEEADMVSGKISNRSPLGEAMINKKKGDVFSLKTPGGMVEYKIIEVE